MFGLIADIVCVLLILAIGTAIGWYLRSRFALPVNTLNPSDDKKRESNILAKLHELAASVAADVNQHSSHMKAISHELSETEDADSAVVMAAIANLVEANKQMQSRLDSTEDRLREQAIELEAQTAAAMSDGLTGLANRRALDHELATRVSEYKRDSTPACVVMVDIDHFKQFNDTYGHRTGDHVLKRTTELLVNVMRKADYVARYGGEEFALVLPNTTLQEGAEIIESARKVIEEAVFHYKGVDLNIKASLGMAGLLEGETPCDWVARADSALYAAKEGGRNRCYTHDDIKTCPVENILPTPPRKEETKRLPESVHNEGQRIVNEPTEASSLIITRSDFCSKLHQHLSEIRRGGNSAVLVLLEIDHFKELSKQHGMEFTNAFMQTVSQLLKLAIRDLDLIARFDLNCFALLLHSSQIDGALIFAERLRKSLKASKPVIQGHATPFTVSLGIAEVTRGETVPEFLSRTEAALDSAVANNQNKIWFHNGEAVEAASEKGAGYKSQEELYR